MTPEKTIVDIFAPFFAPAVPVVRRSAHADFQVDNALALSRSQGRPPRDIAADALAHIDTNLFTATIAGPGFINLTLTDAFLTDQISARAQDPDLGVLRTTSPQIVTIDYSSPNVAKEMHVGHLRSTIIGDAIARVLTRLGHDVRRMNHIGDWGTPFGMLIEHLIDIGEDAPDLSIGDLTAFYQAARVKFDNEPAFVQRSRSRVVALQSGDPETRRLWQILVTESERYFLAVYDLLGVLLEPADFRGESTYNDRLTPVVDELTGLGLARLSDGAMCVFPAGFTGRDGSPLPIIVRKSDGGFGYGATDMASIQYRIKDLKAHRMLYVVGSPQRQHFEMVFAAAREAGWLTADAEATFVGFGSVLGADGKMLKTREGSVIKLADLLAEAVSRADTLVPPHIEDPDERSAIAKAVGIGAVKYADLSTDRVKDYVFDWDRMLATTGDTAAYLQYTCARIHSILRRTSAVDLTAPVELTHPTERALALELLMFPGAVNAVAETLEPHKLATYLFGLAGRFTSFYTECTVLGSPSRLVLSDLTRRTLTQGLALLGIAVPTRM